MAKARHRTPEYVNAYKALKQANQLGPLECAQPVCLMPTRTIPQGAPIDVAHNDAGTHILGPAHRRCNRSDGGWKRWHPQPTRWAL